MKIPDWLIYTTVLVVMVTALFWQGQPDPLLETEDDFAYPDQILAPQSPRGRDLPAPNPFDEQILVQVGEIEPGIGTAFALNTQGIWLTARHVVDGCASVGLQVSPGRIVPVDSVKRSSSSDLALLFTDRAPNTVAIDLQKPLHLGEPAYHIGYPQGVSGEVRSRLLGRNRLVTRGRYTLEEGVLVWAETGRANGLEGTLAGMSGGPVFDANGEVIGVTVAESPRRARIYTAAPRSISSFLEESSINVFEGEAHPLSEQSYSQEADRMRSDLSVVKVICQVDAW